MIPERLGWAWLGIIENAFILLGQLFLFVTLALRWAFFTVQISGAQGLWCNRRISLLFGAVLISHLRACDVWVLLSEPLSGSNRTGQSSSIALDIHCSYGLNLINRWHEMLWRLSVHPSAGRAWVDGRPAVWDGTKHLVTFGNESSLNNR